MQTFFVGLIYFCESMVRYSSKYRINLLIKNNRIILVYKGTVTRIMVPIIGRARSFLVFSEFSKIKKEEGETEKKNSLSIYPRL